MKKTLMIIILSITPLLASSAWIDFFPPLEKIYAYSAPSTIVDMEADDAGLLYILTMASDSVFVEVISTSGELVRTCRSALGPTTNAYPVGIQLSRHGEIIVVRGWEKVLETPVNWVFDSTGYDILEPTHLLKYAEWLQVSPCGNFFSCQGYRGENSQIPGIYDRNFNEIFADLPLEQGFFARSGDIDMLVAKENREKDQYLTARELPSAKILFETKLDDNTSRLSVQEAKIAVTENCIFTLSNLCANRTLYCFDAKTGDFLWENQTQTDIIDIGSGLDGDAVAIRGNFCYVVRDVSGEVSLDYCLDLLEVNFDFSFSDKVESTIWLKYSILVSSFFLYDDDYIFQSLIFTFGDEKSTAPIQVLNLFDGFILNGSYYIVEAFENQVSLYRIIE